MTLLEILALEDGASLSDVALRAGVPASTAHRILNTLEAHKFVTHDEERGFWFIGVHAFQIGNAFLRNRRLVDIGRTTMRSLMHRTGESVNLAIEDDGELVFISQIESHAPIRSFHRAGSRTAMHASGAGKALLSTLSTQDVRDRLQRTGLDSFTDHTLVHPDALLHELDKIREQGWAVDNEERHIGMRCVAAPIFDEHAEAIAAISIAGPTSRMDAATLGEYGPLVKRAAQEITDSIGGERPARQVAAT